MFFCLSLPLRVFDSSTGHPVAVMHHFGKNPYGALDPLQLGGVSNAYGNVSVIACTA